MAFVGLVVHENREAAVAQADALASRLDDEGHVVCRSTEHGFDAGVVDDLDLVVEVAGPTGTVVGDRPDTDGLLARALGWDFALVMSGVVDEDDLPVDPLPDSVHADLAAVVEAALG